MSTGRCEGIPMTYTRYKSKSRTQEIDTIDGKWVNALTKVKVKDDNRNISLETAIVICGRIVAIHGHGVIGNAGVPA
jgi:hypothetical protein